MYKNIESNVYGDRKQELPVVSEIESEKVEEIKFKLNDENVDAYKVTLEWEYEKDLGYDEEKEIILVKEDSKLSIVETH